MKTGCCQCGAIKYQLESEPLMTYACHCKDCQKRTGSAFSMGVIFPTESLDLSGELTAWDRISDDGNANTRYSCSQCGNVIYGASTASPQAIKLQAGTLDDTQNVKPDVHIWAESAQAWVNIPSEDLRYDTQPDNLMDIFAAVQMKRDKA